MRKSICLFLFAVQVVFASGHGPVFGLATPTNPQGGWSFDTSLMGRNGRDASGVMMRGLLGYGITESLKVSVSAPLIIRAEGLVPARVAGFTPMGSDVEGLLTWRFQRRDTGVGSRYESTAVGGVLKSDGHPAGFYSGLVSGLASRSHYAWGGVSYQRYGAGNDPQRPDILSYSAVYGYRPHSWRTDYPRWDWRVFGEMTGERAGTPLQPSQQVFVGPSTLGIYKQYAISGGIQFPVHQSVSPVYPRERFRFTINFTYFF